MMNAKSQRVIYKICLIETRVFDYMFSIVDFLDNKIIIEPATLTEVSGWPIHDTAICYINETVFRVVASCVRLKT